MSKEETSSLTRRARKVSKKLASFSKGIWFFPAVLFVFVLVLSFLQINGSSIGIYHKLFYGDSAKDGHLLVNEPRIIRSDEWLVTTQLSLAQTKTDFTPVNKNIGDGIDVSLLVDAPTRDVVQFFKPHNFGFFVLSPGVAFSLKWWLLAYFLVMAVYFFVITLLPKRRLFAILLSLGFLASPFIVWWYQYITLAPIYYALFGIVVAIKMMRSQNSKIALLWGVLLAYISTSFVLVLYPPFQIPCALFAIAFLMGYILDNKKDIHKNLKQVFIGGGGTVVLTLLFVATCLLPKLSIIDTVSNTAYPGNRMTESGGFNTKLFLANNTLALTQDDSRAGAFSWISNQSEGSNFLLVFILFVPLLVFFVIRYRKKIPNFWTAISILVLTLVFMVWLFAPNMDLLGKLTLLNRVPYERLLVGFGLINLSLAIIFVQILEKKQFHFSNSFLRYIPLAYSLGLLLLYIFIDLYVAKSFPNFMGWKWAILLAIPYPLIIYLFLKRRFNIAAIVLLVFSILSVIFIHPLYKGVDVLNDSKLSKAIRGVDRHNSKRWTTDSLQLENFAILNGKQSLSGVYVYPDLELWEKGFPNKADTNKYNRYAHVSLQFDRDASQEVVRTLNQPNPDQLTLAIEPCDEFLQRSNVGYILTAQEFTLDQAPCAKKIRYVTMPEVKIYIYKLSFNNKSDGR